MNEEIIHNLQADVKEIKENHLPHLSLKLVKIGTDVDWLKKFFWIVSVASIGSLITALFNLILK